MITVAEERYILDRAYKQEQSVALMTRISDSEPFLRMPPYAGHATHSIILNTWDGIESCGILDHSPCAEGLRDLCYRPPLKTKLQGDV